MKKEFLRVIKTSHETIYLPYWKNKMSQYSVFTDGELFTRDEWAKYVAGFYGDDKFRYEIEDRHGSVVVEPCIVETKDCFWFFGARFEGRAYV